MKKLRKHVSFIVAVIIILILPMTAYAGTKDVKSSSETDSTFLLTGMPEIAGEGAIVVDMKTGYTMYEKDIYKKLYPASITNKVLYILIPNRRAAHTINARLPPQTARRNMK